MKKAPHPIFGKTYSRFTRRTCFVLMPFRKKWSAGTWSAIRSALSPYGVLCQRADEQHGQIIIDDIWRSINSAEVIVADVTGKNPNVFYELGIAHTVGKDVLLICQSTKHIVFDVNRFRHILYRPTQRGWATLKNDIIATLREKRVLNVPLPQGVRVEKPSRTLGEHSAAFSGIWAGTWRGDKPGALPHIFVVEKIKYPRANVIYAHGSSRSWRQLGSEKRRVGTFRGDSLWLRWSDVQIRYWFPSTFDVLHAQRKDSGGVFHASLRKLTTE